ncbi:MBL fold metallo-hydrolase [Novosphingobium tardum]|uniref:MBL fold metallo-hydrolase n=1 Tax=Novosphingobium tardum TaxID=1538021 RepID=A0ABV8RJP6_9SPHN
MANRYYQGPPSDHFDGVRFFNPGHDSTDRSLREILRWKLYSRPTAWPTSVPIRPVRPDARVAGLRVTHVGHVTMLIQVAGLSILTDPVWSERASPLTFAGPKRVTAPAIALADLPRIDVVLLSHSHYDHLDIATLRELHRRDAPLMAMPLGNDAIVRATIPEARIAIGDWWDRLDLPAGCATTITPAYHWSNRSLSDVRMALWSGHYLQTPHGSVWFAGDTGYGDGAIFRDLRARLGPPDLALLPIGSYEPRWFMAAQHVNPAEAVQIMEDTGANRALGIHWGTFQLTDEGYEDPALALDHALKAKGIEASRFTAARPGDVFELA